MCESRASGVELGGGGGEEIKRKDRHTETEAYKSPINNCAIDPSRDRRRERRLQLRGLLSAPAVKVPRGTWEGHAALIATGLTIRPRKRGWAFSTRLDVTFAIARLSISIVRGRALFN
jgi:hypothetical protein